MQEKKDGKGQEGNEERKRVEEERETVSHGRERGKSSLKGQKKG